jgi:hypothetical protein
MTNPTKETLELLTSAVQLVTAILGLPAVALVALKFGRRHRSGSGPK